MRVRSASRDCAASAPRPARSDCPAARHAGRRSHDHQFGAQRAGCLERLHDGDDVARRRAERVERAHHRVERRRPPRASRAARRPPRRRRSAAARTVVCPCDIRVRLRHVEPASRSAPTGCRARPRRGRCARRPPITTVPVRSLITTRAGDVHVDRQRLDPRDQLRDASRGTAAGTLIDTVAGSTRLRRRVAELAADRVGEPMARCRSPASLSDSRHLVSRLDRRRAGCASTSAAARHAADGEVIDLHAVAAACRRRTRRSTARPAPARDRAVRSAQRRRQQRCRPAGCARRRPTTRVTSRRAPCRANGGSSAVTSTAAMFSIFDLRAVDTDAELLEHVRQRLRREDASAACRRSCSSRPPGRSR